MMRFHCLANPVRKNPAVLDSIPLKMMGIARLSRFQATINLNRLRVDAITVSLSLINFKVLNGFSLDNFISMNFIN